MAYEIRDGVLWVDGTAVKVDRRVLKVAKIAWSLETGQEVDEAAVPGALVHRILKMERERSLAVLGESDS